MNPRFVGPQEFTFEPPVKGPTHCMLLVGNQVGIYRPDLGGAGTLAEVYTLCPDGVARIILDGTPVPEIEP